MGKLAKSLKNSIWYASKILNGTRYAEPNWEVRGTPWGEGVIASNITGWVELTRVVCPMSIKATLEAVHGGCLNYTAR